MPFSGDALEEVSCPGKQRPNKMFVATGEKTEEIFN